MPEKLPAPNLAIPRSVWGILCLAIGIRLFVALGTGFTNEDFLITLRYADNLAHGKGLVFNPGEWYLGTTTPLYALFLSACIRCGVSPFLAGKSVNILADGLLCLVVFRWLAGQGHRKAGIAAAFLLAIHPWSIRWAVSGMETSLVTLGGAYAWLCLSEKRYRAGYITLAILFLLRWDSLLLTVLFTIAAIARERQGFWREGLLFLAIILPWLIFATGRYGSPVPTTMLAKATVYGWRFQGVFLPELPHFGAYFAGAPLYTGLSALALIGLARLYKKRAVTFAAPIVWFGCYWTAFLLSKNLLFPWYLVPPLPIYLMLAAIGLEAIEAKIPDKAQSKRLAAAVFGGVGACVMAGAAFVGCRESQRIEDNLRLPMALWLKQQTQPTDRIMLEPIGYVGYYSGRPVLDVIGLATPYVLSAWRKDNPAPFWTIARQHRPEWCVLRPGEWERIKTVSNQAGHPWEQDYSLVKTFAYTPSQNRELITFHVFRRKELH